jgi:cold-inducible RNA-binding protein
MRGVGLDDSNAARISFDRPASFSFAGPLGGSPCWSLSFDPGSFVGVDSVLSVDGLLELVMSKKLYVGNLSYSVDNTQLEEMFATYGDVRSAEVIQDRDTGRSKGFGFVEMSDDNAAREAIEGLNNREQDGRALTVNEARPKESRSGGGGGGYGGGGGGRGGSSYSRR